MIYSLVSWKICLIAKFLPLTLIGQQEFKPHVFPLRRKQWENRGYVTEMYIRDTQGAL